LGGIVFEELVGATRRLSLITKAIKQQRPPQKRKKVPFTLELAQKYFLANKGRITSLTASTFDDTRDFMVVVVAIYQLCCLSEITNTSPPSQDNAFPIFIGDLKFFTRRTSNCCALQKRRSDG
jgi:hypothetical protein